MPIYHLNFNIFGQIQTKKHSYWQIKNKLLIARKGWLGPLFSSRHRIFLSPKPQKSFLFYGFFYKFLRFLGLRAALIPNEAKQVEPILKVAP